MNNHQQEDLHAVNEHTFGPAARYSEYLVGSLISYRVPEPSGATIREGIILFVIAPTDLPGPKGKTLHAPASYVIEQDGFPDVIYQSDIIGLVPPLSQ